MGRARHPTRTKIGASASHAHRGRMWEDRLEAMHAVYMARGRAYVQRNGAPAIATGRTDARGRLVMIATDRAPPDYTVIAEGRALVLDAKSCASGRWALSNIHDHQADAFDLAERAGGIGGILLWMEEGRRMHALLWRDIATMWWQWRRGNAARGEASLTDERAGELAVYSGRDADYLGAVLRAAG